MQFKDIIGQNEVKRRLIQTVKESRVSHAQLFHGPEGSRKLALAIAYAQFINCRNRIFDGNNPAGGDSCGTCPSCIKYAKLIHPDLHFIYPVAKTKEVDKDPMSRDFLKTWRESLLENDYRLNLNDWYKVAGFDKKQGIINADDCSEILRTLSYKSYESEFKVMIIWMADRLYHAAAPKILKILEEPPDKSLFILVTESPEKIINTILSRTQSIKFQGLADQDLFETLTEKYSYDPEEAKRIIPLAEGNLNRAVKILLKDEDEIYYLEKFILWTRLSYSRDYANLLDFIGEIAKLGREKQKNFLAYSERIVRNAMLINYKNTQLSRLNQEEQDFLVRFSVLINYSNIHTFTEEFEKAQFHIERNANPSILFTDLSLTIADLLLSGMKASQRK